MPGIRLFLVVTLAAAAASTHVAHGLTPLAGATQVAAGGEHTCALTSGGGVKCWGNNFGGQLGTGSNTSSSTPADVAGLTSGVVAIATGGYHTCALTSGGGVKCWGYNPDGQLGIGPIANALTPVDVVGLTAGVTAIAAGRRHTCAVTTGGGLKCWGDNNSGQLGNGTTVRALTPVDVTGLSAGVAAVAAGGNHTCALTAGGGAKCWGNNGYGQLGNGSNSNASTPVDVTGLPAGVTAIAAGGDHACVLTGAGGAKCWGLNEHGQLGNGATTNASTPADVTGLTASVAAIAAGGRHTCALTAGGGTKCWGLNYYGQLGNGTTVNATTPADVSGLAPGIAGIAAGDSHSCGRTAAGNVNCWGRNSFAQLGNGMSANALTPGDVIGLATGVATIRSGNVHTCALTAGGGARCWGGNFYGQLGIGTTSIASTPVDVAGLSTGVAALAAGGFHTCAVTSGTGVRCWGNNWFGNLGNGTYANASSPVDVTGLGAGAAAVSAGAYHSCALTAGGGVKCWGDNSSGQLGNGSATNALTPVDVAGLPAGVASIAAGGRHTCALTTGGGVKCWGNNSEGQLGNGTTVNAPTPVDVTGLSAGIAAIAAGGSHTCALTAAGGMKCWGRNANGQVGDGAGASVVPSPVDVTGLTAGVAAIAAGGFHTCALTTAGGMKCWGANFAGQLGNGSNTVAPRTPADVPGLTAGVAAIAASEGNSCAITTGGVGKCWGDNAEGQVGNGIAGFHPAPQVVIVACVGFLDVDPYSAFCANVEWLKNRAVTQGCTSTIAYCPADVVTRLAMAAFMNRLGTAFVPGIVSQRFTFAALDPGADPIVCAEGDRMVPGFPRRAHLDGVLTAYAPSDLGLAVDPVVSTDGGATWQTITIQGQRGFVRADRWGNLRSLGEVDLAPGQRVRFGLRVSRGGLPGAAAIGNGTCNLRVRIDNRNGAASPFDADD